MADTPRRAGIYCRLSEDPDGTKPSIDRQEREARALCEKEGFTVTKVYKDRDLSGFKKGVVRPAFEDMLADLEAGIIDAVVCFKLDRLSRQPGQFERVLDALDRRKAVLRSVHESTDITNPLSLAMIRIGLIFANYESHMIAQRVKAAKKEAAFNGELHTGGTRPFGMTADKKALIEEEAALIREAAQRVLLGEGLNSILRDWTAKGVNGVNGKPIGRTSLKQTLTRPSVAGFTEWEGEIAAKGNFPAILDEQTWKRVCAKLEKGKRDNTRSPNRYLLSRTILKCGKCGGGMHGKSFNGPKQKRETPPRYVCASEIGQCGGPSMAVEAVDGFVWRALARVYDKRLGELRAKRDGQDKESEEAILSAQIEQWREAITRAADDHYRDNVMPRDIFLSTTRKLQADIDKATQKLDELQAADLLIGLQSGETILEAESRPLAWRRSLVDLLIQQITIHPASNRGSRKIDSSRIEILWKK